MKRIIKIADLIGLDIRSRQNAAIIRQNIKDLGDNDIIELNFKGVRFISRSFADEICNIKNEKIDKVAMKNMTGVVNSMIGVVSESRDHKRVRRIDNTEIKEFKDIESLSAYFSTI